MGQPNHANAFKSLSSTLTSLNLNTERVSNQHHLLASSLLNSIIILLLCSPAYEVVYDQSRRALKEETQNENRKLFREHNKQNT